MNNLPKGQAITLLQQSMQNKTPVTLEIRGMSKLRECQIKEVTHSEITVSHGQMSEIIEYEDITEIETADYRIGSEVRGSFDKQKTA